MTDRDSEIRDAAVTLVGFAVLGFQRLQVARRQAEREMGSIARSLMRHGADWYDERDASAD